MTSQHTIESGGPTAAAPATHHARCPECDGRVQTEDHETVCIECGVVLEGDQLDYGPEWRDDDARSRGSGAVTPSTRHDKGLGSNICYKHQDAEGRTLDNTKRRQLSRLRMRDSRARVGSKQNRNQITGITDVKRMASALGLPDSVTQQACRLFKSAQNAELLQGRCIEGFSSAALYAAARLNQTPRTLSDVAHVSKVDESTIRTSYQVLNRQLELPVPPNQPIEYLPQLASGCDLPPDVEQAAAEVLESMAADNRLQGSNPAGVAASVLYLVADQPGIKQPTQDELCEAAGISPVTIRNNFPAIRNYL